MLGYISKVQLLITEANKIYQEFGTQDKKFSWFLTNRSFIAAVIGFLILVLNVMGVSVPAFISEINVDLFAGHLAEFATGVMLAYAWLERMFGKTRAVFNIKQAKDALTEAATQAIVANLPLDDVKNAVKRAGIEDKVTAYPSALFGVTNK